MSSAKRRSRGGTSPLRLHKCPRAAIGRATPPTSLTASTLQPQARVLQSPNQSSLAPERTLGPAMTLRAGHRPAQPAQGGSGGRRVTATRSPQGRRYGSPPQAQRITAVGLLSACTGTRRWGGGTTATNPSRVFPATSEQQWRGLAARAQRWAGTPAYSQRLNDANCLVTKA